MAAREFGSMLFADDFLRLPEAVGIVELLNLKVMNVTKFLTRAYFK